MYVKYLIFAIVLIGLCSSLTNYSTFAYPLSSDTNVEYKGSFTFGPRNKNGISYSPGQNPLTNASGLGNTKIINNLSGHISVLESNMSSGTIYKEFLILDEAYHSNCEPSPTTGVQTVEWYWAFDTVPIFDWTPSPTVWIYTDTDSDLSDDSGVVYMYWEKPPSDNDQFICQVKTLSGGATTVYETPNNAGIDLSDTVSVDIFYHFQISLDYDSDQITWSVNGSEGWRSETWSTSNLETQLGKITKIAFGAGFSYTEAHWIDSLSWSWDSNYTLGDLLSEIEFPPNAPVLDDIAPVPIGEDRIVLDWNDVEAVDNYTIYRHTSIINELNSSLTNAGTSNTSLFMDFLSETGDYYYVVTATNQSGTSGFSNCESVYVEIPDVPSIPGFNVWNIVGIVGGSSVLISLKIKKKMQKNL